MIYESPKTEKGNIGVSYISAELAVEQAQEMDNNGCINCYACSRCSYCSDCSGFVDGKVASTPQQSIENLDKVRAIILDDEKRLEMGHWHQDDSWVGRTCAEETLCNTTHCLAGWLQVCSTDTKIRELDAQTAGFMAAPIAGKMFFRPAAEVKSWLQNRDYVQELGIVEPATEQP